MDSAAPDTADGTPDGGPSADPSADPATDPPGPTPWALLRRLLIGLAVSLGLAAVVLVAVGVLLYRAATASPPEYEALLSELDDRQQAGELDRERRALESQVAALYSEAQHTPRWQSVVTEDQLNGWLVVQLPVDLPELARKGVRQPRVMLADGAATLACRAEMQGVDAVVTVAVAPLVAGDGWAGFEVLSVKVGRLPLPIRTLTERFDTAVESLGPRRDQPRYRWAESNGNPVLLFDVERLASSADQSRRVDTFEVRKEGLFIGGVTEDRRPLPLSEAERPAGPDAALPPPTP